MKHRTRIHASIASALALLPAAASAHPGHSAFDFRQAAHAGHGIEWAVIAASATLLGLAALIVRRARNRR